MSLTVTNKPKVVKKEQQDNNEIQKAEAPKAQQGQTVDSSKYQGFGKATADQNTKAFQSLDTQAQQIISSNFVKKSWTDEGGWGDMNKMAEQLNASGYNAKVGKSSDINTAGGQKGQNVMYLEITDKSGKTVRLWDANGDGGFGKADMNLNGALGSFKNDIANRAGNANNAAPVGNQQAGNVQAQNQQAQKADNSKNAFDPTLFQQQDYLTGVKTYLEKQISALDPQNADDDGNKVQYETELTGIQQSLDLLKSIIAKLYNFN